MAKKQENNQTPVTNKQAATINAWEMDFNQALSVLFQVADLAQQRGILDLESAMMTFFAKKTVLEKLPNLVDGSVISQFAEAMTSDSTQWNEQ